jgi:hypothetical protein
LVGSLSLPRLTALRRRHANCDNAVWNITDDRRTSKVTAGADMDKIANNTVMIYVSAYIYYHMLTDLHISLAASMTTLA